MKKLFVLLFCVLSMNGMLQMGIHPLPSMLVNDMEAVKQALEECQKGNQRQCALLQQYFSEYVDICGKEALVLDPSSLPLCPTSSATEKVCKHISEALTPEDAAVIERLLSHSH